VSSPRSAAPIAPARPIVHTRCAISADAFKRKDVARDAELVLLHAWYLPPMAFAGGQIGALPVVELGNLIGLITVTDVLTAEVDEAMH